MAEFKIEEFIEDIREAKVLAKKACEVGAFIDKISGKGTWDANSFVFVYEFELVD